ncbi:hypothetical protein ARMA_2414 [Ardenticatena maritima]|uniref:Uncharacterized protein n=1 Tax=Ardenticatena maritima TaxID=872965 RepID=A0A0M8KA44_9CHLR|nr:hypothetical protein [Ardenticatena maritima]KPL85714.1 hypothetical protein SE16_15145 [Ardenticatena maritima]GAP63991.1 hypothetical protein ARMA_2414 [Ardenticatena maritima]
MAWGWLLALGVLIALVGLGVVWWMGRKPATPHTLPPGADVGGYGRERWARERRMWAATLARLERQAERLDPVPPHLMRDIEQARKRLARAEMMLNEEDTADEGA